MFVKTVKNEVSCQPCCQIADDLGITLFKTAYLLHKKKKKIQYQTKPLHYKNPKSHKKPTKQKE